MSTRGTTTSPLPRGGRAVMERRKLPTASLDYFPTPPWATRALLEHVIPDIFDGRSGASADAAGQPKAPLTCWEPAAGEGHMAAVLGERFGEVWRSDVHDYGGLHAVGSFVGQGADVVPEARFQRDAACPMPRPDWIITNPPFNLAEAFALRAIDAAARGVALLVRTNWLESAGRFNDIFRPHPPSLIALYVERVPMVAGRWDPDASTATSYAWVIWDRAHGAAATRFTWIPPGCRDRLTRPDDRRRFAPETLPPSMFDAASGPAPERPTEHDEVQP